MRIRSLVVCAALVTLVLSCSSGEGDVSEPTAPGGQVFGDLAYSARVLEVEHTQTTVKQLTLRVELTNQSDEMLSRAYPAGCPVRIRLYRVLDNALVYDESRFPCGAESPIGFSLGPQQSIAISSGTRNPWEVAGDSLPVPASYYAAALVRVVGQNPIEIDAGVYRLPFCRDSFPPGAYPITYCSY